MKIAYIITRANEVGGAHIHVRDLGSWLQAQGHDVRVFVGGDGAFIDILQKAGLPYTNLEYMKRPISPLNDIVAIKELTIALNEFQPDIVSAHSAKAGIIARIASAMTGYPCVFTAHGWSFTNGVKWPASFIFMSLEKLLAPLAKNIVTVCENDRALALEKRITKPDKIRAIHNGMPELYDSTPNPFNRSSTHSPTIVMVARFEEQKDHSTLITALSHLKDMPWSLQLVGDGPLQEKVKFQVGNCGLGDRVYFLGRRQDIPDILERADIFVLTTNWEGFPRSILEAMRAGLPVVATDVAGVSEAVQDQITGFLVHQGDTQRVGLCLSQLLESEDLRRKLGAKGLEHFHANFTFDKMANKTFNLYTEIVTAYPRSQNT